MKKISAKITADAEYTLCPLIDITSKELMPNYKNIKIHEDTHERLQSHGNMDESFNDLINRILDDWEEQREGDE
jgi:hypothetical protein